MAGVTCINRADEASPDSATEQQFESSLTMIWIDNDNLKIAKKKRLKVHGFSWEEMLNDPTAITVWKLSFSLLKGRPSDGFPIYQEKIIRESIRKFPYCEATLLQQLVRSIAPVEIVRLWSRSLLQWEDLTSIFCTIRSRFSVALFNKRNCYFRKFSGTNVEIGFPGNPVCLSISFLWSFSSIYILWFNKQ